MHLKIFCLQNDGHVISASMYQVFLAPSYLGSLWFTGMCWSDGVCDIVGWTNVGVNDTLTGMATAAAWMLAGAMVECECPGITLPEACTMMGVTTEWTVTGADDNDADTADTVTGG